MAKPDDFYRLYGLKQQVLHGDCNEERPMVRRKEARILKETKVSLTGNEGEDKDSTHHFRGICKC